MEKFLGSFLFDVITSFLPLLLWWWWDVCVWRLGGWDASVVSVLCFCSTGMTWQTDSHKATGKMLHPNMSIKQQKSIIDTTGGTRGGLAGAMVPPNFQKAPLLFQSFYNFLHMARLKIFRKSPYIF